MSMTAAELLEAALDGTLQDDDAPNEQPDAAVTDDATGAAAPEGQDKQEAGNAETEVEGAPILSKSGAYTIPYQKLVDARTDRDAWKQRAEQLEAQVQSLSTQQQANLASAQQDAQNRADAGQAPTQADHSTSTMPAFSRRRCHRQPSVITAAATRATQPRECRRLMRPPTGGRDGPSAHGIRRWSAPGSRLRNRPGRTPTDG